MADLNTIYSGTNDQQDPDVIVDRICKFNVAGFCVGGYQDMYLPDGLRQKIRQINADSASTIEAVKVPYTGTTIASRVLWLNTRIDAINERVKFIKARTDELLSRMQSISTDSYNTLTKLVTTGLSLIPVVGSVATYAQSQADSAQTLEQYKVQSLIQDYAKDLQELATIRTQLLSDLAKANTSTTNTDPTNEAPTVSTWYYVVGLGLLLLLFVYLRRRNQKRRKR